ncbi:MAG TPA: UdgX family uracil-DNA binding protein [Acidobacteriaceae bacterium]|nr:UdgX family uracil-DNA binding protein [Acidobacteriaceae bacterium]
MKILSIPPDFDGWRTEARQALIAGWSPAQLDFQDTTVPHPLALLLAPDESPDGRPFSRPHVPKAFLDAAQTASVHRDSQRWNLLYRLLYRLQTDRNLLSVEVDSDVAALHRLSAQVARDLHKMHAFVRFRKVDEPDPADPAQTAEHYIAWYRPDHRILHLAAPFFAERFAPMRWTILTPDESVTHDPATHQLTFGPGLPREAAPREDELESLWRSYYGSIFNPARLNPWAMRSDMPVRYWQNLPEMALLPHLIQTAEARVASMVTRQAEKPTAAPFVPAEHKLPVLSAALPSCKGCDLFLHATQVVPGAGSGHARLMLVGEQPGDKEDLEGAPFVGPAGHLLHKALEELRIKSADVYLTNAVKHFKYVKRGSFRLHQNPRTSEINACRPWLLAEIDAVKPRVILCLGASASKSLLGGTFALMRERGQIKSTPYAERVLATIHPSAVLRARDQQGREQLYNFLRDDLALAYSTATGPEKSR